MKDKLNALITKILTALRLVRFREQIMYLIIGGLTTVVDWAVFTLMVLFVPSLPAPFENSVSYAVAWLCAVLFSFWTSKYFVFEDAEKRGIGQFMRFFAARLATLGISLFGDFVLCGKLQWNTFWVKAIISVVVIIVNYITGKWIVFIKEKRGEKETSDE